MQTVYLPTQTAATPQSGTPQIKCFTQGPAATSVMRFPSSGLNDGPMLPAQFTPDHLKLINVGSDRPLRNIWVDNPDTLVRMPH